MRKSISKMPVMEFGSRSGKVTIGVGGRGRVQVSGKGSFTVSEFATFLRQASWFHDQVVASGESRPTKERGAGSSPVKGGDVPPPTPTSPQLELFGHASSHL